MSLSKSKKPAATFLVCGHQSPPEARPVSANAGVNFNEPASLYVQPAMCLTCSINHAKNRQQTTIEAYQSQIDLKMEEIIDRAMRVSNERDRTEILETGKRLVMADIILDRNREIVDIWQDLAMVWNLAKRDAATGSLPAKKGGPAQTKEVLSIRIDRTVGNVKVVLTWKTESHDVVETNEIMGL